MGEKYRYKWDDFNASSNVSQKKKWTPPPQKPPWHKSISLEIKTIQYLSSQKAHLFYSHVTNSQMFLRVMDDLWETLKRAYSP